MQQPLVASIDVLINIHEPIVVLHNYQMTQIFTSYQAPNFLTTQKPSND